MSSEEYRAFSDIEKETQEFLRRMGCTSRREPAPFLPPDLFGWPRRMQLPDGTLYLFDDSGTLCDPATERQYAAWYLCNFHARIRRRLIIQPTHPAGRPEVILLIEGRLAGYGPLPPVEVPLSEFEKFHWVDEHWWPKVWISPKPGTKAHLAAAIRQASGNFGEHHVYRHLGWQQVGQRMVYLHADGALDKDGPTSQVSTRLESPLDGFLLPKKVSQKKLCEAVRASLALLDGLAPDEVMAPLVAAAYTAPLGAWFPLDFSLFLFGPSQAYKTSLAAVIQAHWGTSWNSRHLPLQWLATPGYLEHILHLAKDVLVVVDDFVCRRNALDNYQRKAELLMRAAGNQAGRGRLNSLSQAGSPPCPRGLILATGETLPEGNSLQARVWTIPLPRQVVCLKRLSQAQHLAAQGVYAQAMAAYVRWLARKAKRLAKRLPALRQACCKQFQAATLPRQVEIAGTLAAGMRTFLDFATAIKAITAEEAARRWETFRRSLQATLVRRAMAQEQQSPGRQFLEMLARAVAAGKAHLAGPDDQPPLHPEPWGWYRDPETNAWRPFGPKIGWVRYGLDPEDPPPGEPRPYVPTEVYLHPDRAHDMACQMARRLGRPLPSQHAVSRSLREQRLLLQSEPGRNTIKVTVGRSRQHVLLIHPACLNPNRPEYGEELKANEPFGPDDPLLPQEPLLREVKLGCEEFPFCQVPRCPDRVNPAAPPAQDPPTQDGNTASATP